MQAFLKPLRSFALLTGLSVSLLLMINVNKRDQSISCSGEGAAVLSMVFPIACFSVELRNPNRSHRIIELLGAAELSVLGPIWVGCKGKSMHGSAWEQSCLSLQSLRGSFDARGS